MTVARGAKAGTPVPTEPEAIPADTEFTLSDGDSALFPPNAAGEVRNDGDEDATAWVTNVALFTTRPARQLRSQQEAEGPGHVLAPRL